MGETLFLAHRIPFPPDRGDKIRSHHLLKGLAAIGPVHVGTLGETEADFAAEPALAEIAASYCLAQRQLNLPFAGLKALARNVPVSLAAFDSPTLGDWVSHTLATRPIDCVFVFSGQMGQYVPADYSGRLIVDLCDVDSAKFAAYAAGGNGPRAWIDAREARLLAEEERKLAHRADATLLITDEEAQLLRRRIGATPANVLTLPNGIDTALYDPLAVVPHPALVDGPGPHIVFTGQMDYQPNVAAALRTIDRLLPSIRRELPGATFHVVGRAPVAELVERDGDQGVRVWGEVPDVRPFLAAADLVVAPLAIARGVQNKVLEAMAMARPVLVTPEAATGIDTTDGEHLAVESDDAALASRACAILQDGPRALAMGAAARRFVVEQKGWDTALAQLPELVGRSATEPTRDAA
ncbi:TIGR03087 family PEP-CTERM/XrtA system glycosyltransferase [Tsuneonella mangrovi]|uniref:TIGR03087 family PEP-CTERM/XrtA system glycosyltransferase n=1 Tax=Tsuneonella mangrovi TaxID=1982042 RepID=UPI000BA1D183|nr:TIGR03087 family PEP-CTERM/XrtA system glycosyltransferase [Tsuneonella mangrovi]